MHQKKNSGLWLMPPRIKILEALGTIADKRIELKNNGAKVLSSTSKSKILRVIRNHKISDMHEKTYSVTYDGKRKITCNDNGSYYKGYLGYPSIAFLMEKKILAYDENIANALKGIKWKELNEKFKDYYKVEQIIKIRLSRKGIKANQIDDFISKTLEKIKELELEKLE